MSRLRDPDTLCDVVAQFRVLLGANEAAAMIGRSPSVIHRSADPDDDYMLTASQLLMLDEACAVQGHTPFLAYHQRRMDRIRSDIQSVPSAFLDAEVAMGKLAETLRGAIATTSALGEQFTPTEALTAKQAVSRLMDELGDVMKSISAQTTASKKTSARKVGR